MAVGGRERVAGSITVKKAQARDCSHAVLYYEAAVREAGSRPQKNGGETCNVISGIRVARHAVRRTGRYVSR